MRILPHKQGSPGWREARTQYPCASEAPVVMGASKHMTRGELLRLKSAGAEREFSDYVQKRILDKGHEVEVPARAITEQQIGEELFPATAVSDDGQWLASFDGVTMTEDVLLEHKQWNEELAAQVRAGELSPMYYWQLEHQLMVAESAQKVIFVCSDGTEERRVQMEYRRVPGRAEQLQAGWEQFFHDLQHGDHTPAPPKAVAPEMELLPAVSVRMEGALKVVSNLDALAPLLRAFVERIPARPSTDDEFAYTDAACKALKKIEEGLDAAEASALASLDSVEQMQRLKASLHKLARDTRLQREKLVEARKLEIRTEEIQRGKRSLQQHIERLNQRLGKAYMPAVPADFAAAIRQKKTVQSVRDSIDQELARAKIAASEIADGIEQNLRAMRELAVGFEFLFADERQVVSSEPSHCRLMIQDRIFRHRQAEEQRLQAERERIRIEEETRARLRMEAQRQEELRQQEAAAREQERAKILQQHPPTETYVPPPAPAVVPIQRPNQQAAATPPSLRLGQINERIAPLAITAEGLKQLGFEAAAKKQAATLYHEHEFGQMVTAIIAHLAKVRDAEKEAA